jgi:hypothetical protein
VWAINKNSNKGEPVCRPNLPVSDLTWGIYQSQADFCQQIQWWPLLHSSLFCCPSITAQALRAAIVAAELPLRGKLRAEAKIFPIVQRILEVLYQCFQTLLRDYMILCCHARFAPCSTHGQKWTCRPRLFCWVRVSDLESGGARCARRP